MKNGKQLPIVFVMLFIRITQVFSQDADSLSNDKVHYRVPHFQAEMTIDGRMDEAVWEQALVVDANIEVRPAENVPAPVQTQAYLFHNQNYIYVAIQAMDPEPEKIRAHYCDRDQIFDDDWVLILFDTFNDQRRTYDFFCNPYGMQADQIETTTGGGDSWDAIWESSGRITDSGFVVEMAIPFSSLGFQRSGGDQIWGFDVVRSYPRSVRHHIGAFSRDRNNNCYMCQAPKLVGFAGASPGRNTEIDPTFSSTFHQEREDETSGPFIDDKKNEFGLSARWGFSPNMNLNATLNPDFSNIEADAMQLDINNQFAIYYDEKRPFFLEGEDFFSMPLTLVHTRTLADPVWGAKITGKEGGNALGYFTVQDEITNLLFPGPEGSDSESINKKSVGSVLRYRRDLGEKSNIGLLLTDREGDQYYNRLGGLDADFKFTKTDRLQLQVVTTTTQYPDSVASDYDQPDEALNGNAYYLYYEHSKKNYYLYTKYKHVERDFRADLGFITQAGYKYNETGATYKWRADGNNWYNWLSIYTSFDFKRDLQNHPLHKAFTSNWGFEGKRQSYIYMYFELGRDRYDGEEFRANWIQWDAGFKAWPAVDLYTYIRYGDQIDFDNTRSGTRLQLEPGIEWNLGKHIRLVTEHTYEHLNVEAGKLYTANISRFKFIYQFNRRMFLRTVVQYCRYDRDVALYNDDDVDKKTEKFFNQVLFSYKINPQTVFFLGYSDNHLGDHETSIVQTNRTLFAKLGYAYCL